MDDAPDIVRRKEQHLDLALQQQGGGSVQSGFARLRLEHCALPEMDLADVDLSSDFLGRRLQLPFLISSMTGGPDRGEIINRNLAEAAQSLGIALAVGSQRVALEGHAQAGLHHALRRLAPDIPLMANFGAAQLARGYGLAEARRAVEMIGADMLIIHLNPLQEAVQPGGDQGWSGVLTAIEQLARDLERPVIAKEVGFGISGPVARRLRDAGVAALDVAGSGGTDWAGIEAARADGGEMRAVAGAFEGWGISTADALVQVRSACPELPLIGSGGVRDGVDAAKAIALGAALVGQAGPVLRAALHSTEAVVQHFRIMAAQLRIACFCTGSRSLAALRSAPITRA